MSVLAILLLLAAMVTAQSDHAIHGFKYVGCASVTSDKFDAFVNFGRAYNPEQCQSACTGRNYAATFPDGCLCGSSLESFPMVDESLCSNPCGGDAKFGFCGYTNSAGCSYANVYKACDEILSASVSALVPGGPTTTDPAHLITFSTIRLPTITRTLKLATKSTSVIHTTTPTNGDFATSCQLNDDSPPRTPTVVSPSGPVVIVHTVVVHVSPKSTSTPGLQNYGSLPSDPPVATVPVDIPTLPSQPDSNSFSLTSLISYDPIPVTPVPGNATGPAATSTPEGPMFQTLILPDNPAVTTTTFTPVAVTKSPAHRAKLGAAGAVGMVAAMLVAAGMWN